MQIAFDKIAEKYDREIICSRIALLHRRIVWQSIAQRLDTHRPMQILILNCDTGEDAIWLARQGNFVVAADDSELMVRTTSRKAKRLKLDHMIAAKTMGMKDLRNQHFPHKFDLVYVNFEGINRLDRAHLRELSSQLGRVVRPGGRVMAVVRSRRCTWEFFYHSLRLRFRKAMQRTGKERMFVDLEGRLTSSYGYSPKQVETCFRKEFDAEGRRPIGFFLPPMDLQSRVNPSSPMLNYLDILERSCTRFPGLAGWADHFLIDFRLR